MNDGWWSTKAFPLCLHLKPSLKAHQFRPQNPSQPSTPVKKTRIWWLVRKRHGVQTVMGMRGGWRGAEACEVEWLRTWGNGASGQVGGLLAIEVLSVLDNKTSECKKANKREIRME
ncbi:hypothetical protein ES319_D11G334500v1 [Gossypium barbadense]|uniref:Uncharacterized protein n=1 Tax=Gossypium barbadense TaxID=3634 RepID=A0A5J5PJK1_GOSBA|nr:hypothetical protein ES319_D11G334500v1 [Gossypium barbadense]